MSNIYVVDIGTQSMRGIIFNDKGELLYKEQVKYRPYLSKANGYVEQDPRMYWEVLCQITQAIKAKEPKLLAEVVAMSVDTFRDTAVFLDKDMNVLRNSILWSDQRMAKCSNPLPFVNRTLFRLVGMSNTVSAIRRKVKTTWVRENEPEIWAKTYKLPHISGYINYLLTGRLVESVGNLIGHLPINSKKKTWFKKSDLLYPVINVELDKMTELVNPQEVMGTISAEASKLTGLSEGLRVIASGSDKGCETLGVGCLGRNVASISFGTSSTVQFSTKKYFEPEPFLPSYPAVLNGYYNPEVQIFRGYWMISWFKKNFAESITAKAHAQGISTEEMMDDEIEKIPAGSEGLILQPFWQAGLSTPEAKGAIIGFADHHTRAHVYKSIIEGIDFALREGLERMERRSNAHIDYLSVSGGGSQSDVICQICADIFNKPVRRVQTYETSGLGAAIVGFVGVGVYSSPEEAVENMVHYKDEFVPNAENVKIYDKIFNNVYMKLYKKLQPFYKELDKENNR